MSYPASIIVLVLVWTKYLSVKSDTEQNICLDGPFNITRSIGENNVYIPCPFTGQYNPFWSINEIYYEAHTLPRGMIAASYGLFIPTITETMNGSTFQCFYTKKLMNGHNGIQYSSIGTLTVEANLVEYEGFTSLEFQFNQTQRLNLDHQHTVFNKNNKIFVWKEWSAICNNYRITSTTCDGMIINQWEGIVEENTVTVPTDELIHGSDPDKLLLYLEALNSERNICQVASQYIEVDISDVTSVIKASPDGICTNVTSESAIVYVALPYSLNDTTNRPDCFCPIFTSSLNTPVEIFQCSCVSETQFSKSIGALRVSESPPIYEICFKNLSIIMNESVIHFFESLRYCTNKFGREVDVNIRRYITSFKILYGLVNPPTVVFSNQTGQVVFVSQHNHGISLDYYQIVVRDASGQEVFNEIYSNTTNSTNIAERIQQPACSPYTLIVQAHNFLGTSESKIVVGTNTNSEDPCMCIKSNLVVELTLDENEVKVNCSQPLFYESHVQLIISVNNEQNNTVTCDEEQIVIHGLSLDCNKFHTLYAYYQVPENSIDSECIIATNTEELPCQGDLDQNIKIVGGVLGGSLLLVLIVLCITCIKLCRSKHCTGYRSMYSPTIN